jgi:hypothetical protein
MNPFFGPRESYSHEKSAHHQAASIDNIHRTSDFEWQVSKISLP